MFEFALVRETFLRSLQIFEGLGSLPGVDAIDLAIQKYCAVPVAGDNYVEKEGEDKPKRIPAAGSKHADLMSHSYWHCEVQYCSCQC